MISWKIITWKENIVKIQMLKWNNKNIAQNNSKKSNIVLLMIFMLLMEIVQNIKHNPEYEI